MLLYQRRETRLQGVDREREKKKEKALVFKGTAVHRVKKRPQCVT